MDFLNLLLCFLFSWTLVQALLSIERGSRTSAGRLPPGPTPLPIIGNLLKLGNKPHKSLAELAKTHGPIMTLRLGQITTVVISSSTMAREILQKQDLSFSNRFIPDALLAHNHGLFSVVWIPVSTRWRNLRKILSSHLFSGQRLDAKQQLRSQKVKELMAYIHKSCQAGAAVDIGRAAFRTTLNLISNTIFSEDLTDTSSDTAQEFKELVWGIMEEAGKPNLVDYFPVLRKFDPLGIRCRLTIHFEKMIGIFNHMINQRLELRRLQGCITRNDVLDTLLNISESNPNEIDQVHIDHMLVDLFAAGTDTTSSTLEWAMAEILHNPKTLLKAKAELDQILGKGSPVEESDIARLPYLQAIVKETFRLHPAVPFLIPRKVDANVEVCGYTVPKDAQVLVNAWAIGRDPSIWTNPNSFMRERFLGTEIDVRGHDFELIPFGGGRRICPGIPLAIRMVHLMMGTLINSFDWKLEDGIAPEDMNMEEKFGITLQKAQPLRAVPVHV
ncbi:geraniol 8-hydroxylase-like [Cornus florida]|uniref:geraniol 8-hydroxylase-like n=1 Tax=Cornus florida TaxID=4283 RepID=UPI00289AE9CB|nr:geraniol 8-hydroxylase-like [Cornus florida]